MSMFFDKCQSLSLLPLMLDYTPIMRWIQIFEDLEMLA